MIEIGQEERVTVMENRSRETGFLGLSTLHRLHKLYKFDVLCNALSSPELCENDGLNICFLTHCWTESIFKKPCTRYLEHKAYLHGCFMYWYAIYNTILPGVLSMDK